jgi:hypothetical protein
MLLDLGLEGIWSDASPNISPCGFKRACCEALVSADTTGHVKIAISMVLVDTRNVKMTMIASPDGNVRGGILNENKTFVHLLLCVAWRWDFPIQTIHGVPMSLVIGDLQQQPHQVRVVACDTPEFQRLKNL